MDSHTGDLYSESQIEALDPLIKERLVIMKGNRKNIHRISKTLKEQNKAKQRKKLAKKSRKKNR